MSKKEFVEAFAAKTGESKKRSEELISTFLKVVEEALIEGSDVQFVGWGTFLTKERKARIGRNPKDNSKIEIPAKKVVKFKPGKRLSDAIEK